MKLLLDQNLSFKLCQRLADLFPGSDQVRRLGLDQADDRAVWRHAQVNGFVLVTQDSDFAGRILALEHLGFADAALLTKIATALELDAMAIDFARELDEEERRQVFMRHSHEPWAYCVTVRWFPGFYSSFPLPSTIATQADAEQHACDIARARRKQVCLSWSAWQSIWINEWGEVYGQTRSRGPTRSPPRGLNPFFIRECRRLRVL